MTECNTYKKITTISEKLLDSVDTKETVSSNRYVVSIDVGIKNLAVCIFNVSISPPTISPPTISPSTCIKNNNKCSIIHWDVINLCDEEKVRYCDHCKFQAVYQKCVSTTSTESSASAYNIETKDIDTSSVSSISSSCSDDEVVEEEYEYYCKRHSKSIDIAGLPPLPSKLEPNVLKKCKYNELVSLCDEENIILEKINNKKLSKTQILNGISKYCKTTYLELISKFKINAKDISLIDIGTRLVVAFDRVKHMILFQNTTVLIENQISPLANRMKTIQGMITQYFIMNRVHDVIFVSSINKLKDFVTESGDYNDRKKKGVLICKDIIMSSDNFSEKAALLEKSKKKDDMADSFLQGLWYLRKYGYFELDSAIYSS